MDENACFYEIRIAGELDEQWSGWFSDMCMAVEDRESKVTVLSGSVDQAALRGILNKLWDLNLVLITVNRADNSS
jgi:hypothetical protein